MDRCILCNRSVDEVLLIRLPVELKWEGIWLHVIGNANPNEFMCLPCIGFQYDGIERERVAI
jgi:hypothetical protein